MNKIKWIASASAVILCLLTACNSKTQRIYSNEQIIQLKKDGCLIFRLENREKSLAAMTERGMLKAAEVKKRELDKENKEIIQAFKDEYKFSSVYFVYPSEVKKIIEQRLDEVHFLNDSLEVDPNLKPECDYILTGRMWQTQQDTAKYFSGYYDYRGENGIERREAYSGEAALFVPGITIMSDEFVQLHAPFPYFSRKYRFAFRIPTNKMVRKLNKRFYDFYNQQTILEP